MLKYKNGDMKVPAFVWANDADHKTWQQIRDLCELSLAFHHVALMSDGHLGYSMPIGGVFAAKDVIFPAFVGVDIGCGVASTKLSIPASETNKPMLRQIVNRIKEEIPVGPNRYRKSCDIGLMPYGRFIDKDELKIVGEEFNNALCQLGTLGGGNHFIEIQKTDDGLLNLMIHSGSRNLGYKVAKHYHNVAVDLCQMYHAGVPKDLSFLSLKSDEGQNYLKEMQYCVLFAKNSRRLMMQKCIEILREFFEEDVLTVFEHDIAHNYASIEHHFGENVWVHRKGATKAYKGDIGLIPGSQGTNSYVVRGLGNEESFKSCSHGAGRLMSRSKAKDNLDLAKEQEKLDKLDLVHDMRSRGKLDEAPSAYKDIHEVMKSQEDLVKIVSELTPLAVVKG